MKLYRSSKGNMPRLRIKVDIVRTEWDANNQRRIIQEKIKRVWLVNIYCCILPRLYGGVCRSSLRGRTYWIINFQPRYLVYSLNWRRWNVQKDFKYIYICLGSRKTLKCPKTYFSAVKRWKTIDWKMHFFRNLFRII